jgi:tetratricopeptide (TPR) repeat protein
VVALGLVAVILVNIFLAVLHVYAYAHYRAAQTESAANHDTQAKDHLQACLKIWHNDPQCLLLAARTARRLGAFDDTEILLNHCQSVRGKEDDDVYLERVLLRAERGEADSAAPLCRRLVETQDSRAPLIFEAMVHGLIRMYRLEEAAHWLKRWSDRHPASVMPVYFQALIFELKGQNQAATQEYSRALDIDPALDEARTHLMTLLIDLGQGHVALPHVEYLVGRYPENQQIRLAWARCLDQMGEQQRAEALLDEILGREPNLADALIERGKLAYRNKELQKAEECLRRAAVLEPGDRQVQYTLYLCLLDLGRTEEAQTAQARWKQIDEDIGRIQEIVTFQMQANPHDANLHYEAGLISMRSGQPRQALRWFHSALKEDPQHAATHKALAGYYKSVGQFGRASRHRQMAEKSDAGAAAVGAGPPPR